jgi:hypothetical protein
MSKNGPGGKGSATARETETAALDTPKKRTPTSQADREDALEGDEVREALKSRQESRNT